jgi:chemotaxis protein methyltransferase CheR
MLFAEALMDMPFKIEVQIFATDISKKHLQEAGKGEYDEEQMRSVPKHLRDKYFIKSDLDRRLRHSSAFWAALVLA